MVNTQKPVSKWTVMYLIAYIHFIVATICSQTFYKGYHKMFERDSNILNCLFLGYNSGTITELEKKCRRLQTQVFQMEV